MLPGKIIARPIDDSLIGFLCEMVKTKRDVVESESYCEGESCKLWRC